MFQVGKRRTAVGWVHTAPMPYATMRPVPPVLPSASFIADERRPTRNGKRRSSRAVLGLVAAALFGALSFSLLTDGGRATRQITPLLPSLDDIARFAGFGVDEVSVAGYRFTPDGDILDALQLSRGRTVLSFDQAAARQRIEALPWIAAAEMRRIWPGALEVVVRERTAAALWSHNGRHVLIDNTGRQLSAVDPASVPGLPRVTGEGAAAVAAQLLEAVRRHPRIAARLQFAERVADRRWTLHLNDGTKVLLPADREAAALAALTSEAELQRLSRSSGVIVDLRSAGRTVWRSADSDRAREPSRKTANK